MTSLLSQITQLTEGMEVIEPFVLADKLVKAGIVPEGQKTEVAAIVLTTPTSMFLYDGVRLLIQKILHSGSHVVIWTQGDPPLQNAKCETSGLLELAKNTHGHIHVSSDVDKIRILGHIINHESAASKKRIIIVDDKSPQLLRTYQAILNFHEVEHHFVPTDIEYIWARHDSKTKISLPKGFESVDELSEFMEHRLTTVSDIKDLPIYAQTLYLIDFDRTLFDTDTWFRTVQERIVTEVCSPAA